jgi:hypothetical protein
MARGSTPLAKLTTCTARQSQFMYMLHAASIDVLQLSMYRWDIWQPV